jgi:hypothetical protein
VTDLVTVAARGDLAIPAAVEPLASVLYNPR